YNRRESTRACGYESRALHRERGDERERDRRRVQQPLRDHDADRDEQIRDWQDRDEEPRRWQTRAREERRQQRQPRGRDEQKRAESRHGRYTFDGQDDGGR